MKLKTRKCRICKKKIEVKIDRMGRRGFTSKGKAHDITISEDGVFFETGKIIDKSHSGVWFCNDCWEEVRKL